MAVGAKQTWVLIDLLAKQGVSKVVTSDTYPLTDVGLSQADQRRLGELGLRPQAF